MMEMGLCRLSTSNIYEVLNLQTQAMAPCVARKIPYIAYPDHKRRTKNE